MVKQLFPLFFLFLLKFGNAQVFVKNLGNPGIDDGASCMQAFENQIYIAGYSAKSAYISVLDLEGNLLWKNYYSFSDQRNFITDFVVRNNKLMLCGYGHDSGTDVFDEFFVCIDLSSKKVDWARKISLNIKPNNIFFYNGELVVSGDEYAKGKFGVCFIKIDEKNGKIDDLTTWYYTGHESASNALIQNDTLYTCGRYGIKPKTDKYRAAFSQFGISDFNQINSNYFLNSKQDYARSYMADFAIKQDTIIASCFSNNTGIDNHYNLSMISILKNGSVNWAYEYTINGYSSITVKDMLKIDNGYLVLGQSKNPDEDLIFCKFDHDGYPDYAYALGGRFADNVLLDQGKFLLNHNGFIYIAAQSKNLSTMGDYDSFIIKLKEGNEWQDSCFAAKKLAIEISAYEELIEGALFLNEFDTTYKETNIAFEYNNTKTESNLFVCNKELEEIMEVENENYSFSNVAFNNTVLLMDASLSMNRADRMPILKSSLFKILNFMREEDKISAVSFANEAQLILDGISASQSNEIKGKIDSLASSGQSDIIAGIQMGVKLAENHFNELSNNRVIITTDGDLSFDQLKQLKEILIKNKNKNIVFTIFLFNNSSTYYKQLDAIANEVGAFLFVIDSLNVEEVLLNELKAKSK